MSLENEIKKAVGDHGMWKKMLKNAVDHENAGSERGVHDSICRPYHFHDGLAERDKMTELS